MTRLLTAALLGSALFANAQQKLLQSGPLLGYSEMKEAIVWLQTTQGANVFAIYDDASTTENEAFSTDTIRTRKQDGYTAKLLFDQLEPGREYNYKLFIGGQEQKTPYSLKFSTQPDWSYRTDPPSFSMVIGSCNYINEEQYDRPGRPYGGEYDIFKSILDKAPDAMFWLGDNIYLRPADWTSRTGYIHRNTHTRSTPEMQELFASCNHFAIWDDHDFGPNDATGSWIHKDWARETFELFWPNPSFGIPGLEEGINTAFNYMDVSFFAMDNRSFRTEDFSSGPKHIFGKEQTEWLIDALKSSRTRFKVVATGGQFLSTGQVYENHANYDEERAYILKRLDEEDIKGVIFISGDRHHSEVSKMTLPGGNDVYEFTTSPLTSSANTRTIEDNEHRVDGSLIQQRNFAVMHFTGGFRERVLELSYYDSKGELIYEYKVDSQEIYKRN